MKRALPVLLTLYWAAVLAPAQEPERWLHVSVKSTAPKAEYVRVNVPLTLAEKVLPAIKADKLNGGKLKLGHTKLDRVDLQALLEAVRTTPDNEFVTVEGDRENVRVAKKGGYLLVNVRDGRGKDQTVDVKIPFPIVEALLSGGKDELDLVAGVRALRNYAGLELVAVGEKSQTVRVWVDTRNVTE